MAMLSCSFTFNIIGLSKRGVFKTKIEILKKLMFYCGLRKLVKFSSSFFNVFKKIKKISVLKSPFKFKKAWDHFGVVKFYSHLVISFAVSQKKKVNFNKFFQILTKLCNPVALKLKPSVKVSKRFHFFL